MKFVSTNSVLNNTYFDLKQFLLINQLIFDFRLGKNDVMGKHLQLQYIVYIFLIVTDLGCKLQ